MMPHVASKWLYCQHNRPDWHRVTSRRCMSSWPLCVCVCVCVCSRGVQRAITGALSCTLPELFSNTFGLWSSRQSSWLQIRGPGFELTYKLLLTCLGSAPMSCLTLFQNIANQTRWKGKDVLARIANAAFAQSLMKPRGRLGRTGCRLCFVCSEDLPLGPSCTRRRRRVVTKLRENLQIAENRTGRRQRSPLHSFQTPPFANSLPATFAYCELFTRVSSVVTAPKIICKRRFSSFFILFHFMFSQRGG
jgi:hypothetical protein